MNLTAAIQQVEEAIATVDQEIADKPMNWSDRTGTENLRVKNLNHRRHSLLQALAFLRAAQ